MSSLGKIFGFIARLFETIVGIFAVAIGVVTGQAWLTVLGLTLVSDGLGGIYRSLFGGKSGTKTEASKVNVRLAEPIRWLAAGQVRQGGAVLFAEFDAAGNLWYLVVHADSILDDTVKIFLDDIEVTLDGSNNVTNDEFNLDAKKSSIRPGDTAKVPYVQIWTTTYSEADPTPPAISQLAAAFPSKWTSDHKLVGTTYSVVKIAALDAENRGKIYKWRGPLGMGEPGVSIVGNWSRCYDPRDVAQDINDPTTYTFTRNAALIWAWFRTHRYGRNKSRDSINWAKVAEQADICDETVTGIAGTHVRYRCDIQAPEDRTRSEVEQEIMATSDAQLVFDEDGKCWLRVGYYEVPSVVLSRNRDIVAMESVEAQNGESETQGVIVRYTDPSADYQQQPSAAWLNPLYYVEGEAATFATMDVPAIQDHNQAMRIAKAMGMRLQPPHKLVPTIGLRGLKAMRERFVELQYDNEFAGDYEICTQVEIDPNGIFCGMGLVPVNADRWNLLEGEEKPKPVTGDAPDYGTPDLPDVGDFTFGYNNGRIEANIDNAPARNDVIYEFQYTPTADIANDQWSAMDVRMVDGIAYSGPVTATEYTVRYRAVTPSGMPSEWSTDETLTPVIENTPDPGIIYDGGTSGDLL